MNDSPYESGYCSQNFVSVLISIGVGLLLVPLAVVFCAGTGDVWPRTLSLSWLFLWFSLSSHCSWTTQGPGFGISIANLLSSAMCVCWPPSSRITWGLDAVVFWAASYIKSPRVLHRYLLRFWLRRRLWVVHVSYNCLSLLRLTPEFVERTSTTLPNYGIRAVLGSGHGYGPFPIKGGLHHNWISVPQIKLSWFRPMLRDPPWAWVTLLLIWTHVSWIIGVRLANASSFFGPVDASWPTHAASPHYHVCCSPWEIWICPWIFWVIILGPVLHIQPVYSAFWAQHQLLVGGFLLLGHLLFSVAWVFMAATDSSAFVWTPTGYTWTFATILYLISSPRWPLARYYVYGPEFFATFTTFGIMAFMAFIMGTTA
ncbi:hypothetical protein V6N13_057280 [Hibiscus sabdariffa]